MEYIYEILAGGLMLGPVLQCRGQSEREVLFAWMLLLYVELSLFGVITHAILYQ